jgi:ABC-2 type transport system permease protein
MWERIRVILRKEVLQTLREPRMRAVLFVPPMVQLIVFGFAVNLDVENTKLAWVDRDRTPQSRELAAAFSGSRYFEITAYPETEQQIQALLDHGRVQAVVRINAGFARDLLRGIPAPVQLLVDGTNSNTASLVSRYAQQVVTGFRQSGARPILRSEARVWFNPELNSRNYFVPGVIVNIILLVTLMLTALAIVREKEIGTMEQLMVTPLRPLELIIGKTLPFAVVGLAQTAVITTLALVVFRIPLHGNPLLLVLGAALFLMTSLGAGLFISTISHTQQQAMMAAFFFSTPAFMLSGFAFPIRNMPALVQWITYLNPVRYFMEIVRGVFLKGAGLDVLWPQMLSLAIFGVTILTLSALRFRKRLD